MFRVIRPSFEVVKEGRILHYALNDVRASAACFWRFKDLGIIDKSS
jgi:hypothetical protein